MKTDKEKHGLKGPVKSVRIETAQFEERDGQVVEKPGYGYTYTFNTEGQLSEHVTVPETYVYDDTGAKVKIQELDVHENTNVMIGVEGTNSIITVAGAKRIESRYDDRDEVVEIKVFNIDGVLVSRIEITRDAHGNSLEETQYMGDVLPFGDQNAEIAAEVARLFSAGTVMSKHEHTYDEEGRLIESKLTMMGMEVSRQTFVYDEHGNKSEEVSYNESGTFVGKSIFARDYDEYGNWTRELVSTASTWDAEFDLSTPAHVTRRFITYW